MTVIVDYIVGLNLGIEYLDEEKARLVNLFFFRIVFLENLEDE